MLLFWILACLMMLSALFFLLRCLLQQPNKQKINKEVALGLYKDRLAELERDKQAGVLTSENYALLKLELDRTLLNEVETESSIVAANTGQSRDWWAVAIIGLLLPAIAIPLYIKLGQPQLITHQQPMAQQQVTGEGLPSVEEMVNILAERMQENPEDPEGWLMLGKSYVTLGRFSEAVDAFKNLYELRGDEPDVLVRYADAIAMANGGTLVGKPDELIQKALLIDPQNSNGLWLAGMASYEKKDYNQAIAYWRSLLPQLTNDADMRAQIEGLIKKAQNQQAVDGSATAGVVSSESDTNAQIISYIRVKVSVAPELLAEVAPDDSLFIFVQAPAGPAMPIAVVRKQAKDLPLEITLDDSMAMMPTRKLSDFKSVKIGARISKTGNATPQSGDLETEKIQVDVGQSEQVLLSIDRKLP